MLISVACSLDFSFSLNTHDSHLYVIIGTTIALYTCIFAFQLNPLFSYFCFHCNLCSLQSQSLILSNSPSIYTSIFTELYPQIHCVTHNLHSVPMYTSTLHPVISLPITIVLVFVQFTASLCSSTAVCSALMLCCRSSSLSVIKTVSSSSYTITGMYTMIANSYTYEHCCNDEVLCVSWCKHSCRLIPPSHHHEDSECVVYSEQYSPRAASYIKEGDTKAHQVTLYGTWTP